MVKKLKEIIESHEGNTVQISHTVSQVSDILDAEENETRIETPETVERLTQVIQKKKQQILKT